MLLNVYYVLVALAILTMLVGLFLAVRLKKSASGGVVGKVVNLIIGLIALFTAGYAVAPFLPALPKEAALVLLGIVFFFGAIYVVLVIVVIRRLVKKVMTFVEGPD